MNTETREVLNPEQAADYLQVDRETVYRYVPQGKLVAPKLGRTYRVPKRCPDLLLWPPRRREDITLHEHTGADIEDFLEDDLLDDEARVIAARFLTS